MGGGEQAFVARAFETNWISTVGPNLESFEQAMDSRLGVHSVALSSGTAAIHLGLRVLGVQPGDEVFCPTLTFVGTCNPIRYLGAEPAFLDSERDTWNLDPNVLEEALRARAGEGKLPRAVIVVHLYGQCADMDSIRELCARYDVPILEDAAQALGATYKGRPAGTMGDVGVLSFNGNKIITTAGGGMLVSANQEWVEKARFWSQQARDPGLAYAHSELGYNYRLSNVLAGIGRGQVEVLDLRIEQRRGIAFLYRDAFADLPGIGLMPQSRHGLHTNWLSCFLIDESRFGCSRDELMRKLDAAAIESRPVWKPMHLQPLYANCARFGGLVAEDLFQKGICLPSSSSLSLPDQLRVINAVRSAADASELQTSDLATAPLYPSRTAPSSDSKVDCIAGTFGGDLLRRTPLSLDEEPLRQSLRGRVVLVTGAAGSIGSELCRQIAHFHPAAIVGFDIAESPLFELELQMRKDYPEIPFYAEIGTIQNSKRLQELFLCHRPQIVYHAAAYKHVPMMENHPIEAVENNVFGTCRLVSAAAEHQVTDFVLISSDKAVRPTSVMGVTKRIAELVLLAAQRGSTKFVSVRFGNVLESTGSVVPIFRRQIAGGGPVTVTDPAMERFFMTLPEAGELVLQAGAIGKPGQICVLDMGRPVKIVELAERMIVDAGYTPHRDMPIVFTGSRPGEKLFEELSSFLEDSASTSHDRIRALVPRQLDREQLMIQIERLRVKSETTDTAGLLDVLKEMVPEYSPSKELVEAAAGELTRGFGLPSR